MFLELNLSVETQRYNLDLRHQLLAFHWANSLKNRIGNFKEAWSVFRSPKSIENIKWSSVDVCFHLFLLFRATPTACGGSQARGWIRATPAGLHHSHSNARSLIHWARLGIKPASSWMLVWFINRWATTGTPDIYFIWGQKKWVGRKWEFFQPHHLPSLQHMSTPISCAYSLCLDSQAACYLPAVPNTRGLPLLLTFMFLVLLCLLKSLHSLYSQCPLPWQ